MSEKPIERLNYFNGQRLEADDLRLEQEFHIRIQRWLSKSLFSAGVADGLDVSVVEDPEAKGEAQPTKNDKLLVKAGLALDDLGRAIVLTKQVVLIPQARFLCIRYAEHKDRVQQGECAVHGASPGAVARSGGPERIVSDAEFTWRSALPQNDTRELVIAELELNADCTVARVASGPRRFAVATQVSRVHSFALEGEKDIDQHNPKRVYFHVRGRRPSAVTLYLRAEPFSTLFYTELPAHKHVISQTGPAQTIGVLPHRHSLSGIATKEDGVHDHQALATLLVPPGFPPLPPGVPMPPGVPSDLADGGVPPGMLAVIPIITEIGPLKLHRPSTVSLQGYVGLNREPIEIERAIGGPPATLPPVVTTGHSHSFATDAQGVAINTGPVTAATSTATVDYSMLSVDSTGLGPESADRPDTRKGNRLRHFLNLQIFINDKPITLAVIGQLARNSPSLWNATSQINGDDNSPLAFKTDRPTSIRLDLLDGVAFDPGEYWIDLKVEGAGNGGCVHYNLYIE